MRLTDRQKRNLNAVFRMPKIQTMVSRKSSITNAFVNAVIPSIIPEPEEIAEALSILGMPTSSVRCVYCGDPFTEWDHLRPLVLNRRPTGYISEIANLVPSCGKCNQSKGNKRWRDWMLSNARLSPTGRGIVNLDTRISRIEQYERWREPTQVDFAQLLGAERWEHYWRLCDAVNAELRSAQDVADLLRIEVENSIKRRSED